MSEPLWSFEQYVTPAGGKPVEDWYHTVLTEDERDAIRDRVNHLAYVERHQWKRPGFDKLEGEIHEIRKDTADGPIRIYGFFPPVKRHVFVLLEGRYKDQKNDKKGKAIAGRRLGQIKQGRGTTNEFSFEERPATEST